MIDVSIVSFASETAPTDDPRNDAELLAPVVDRALDRSGLEPERIGLICSAGSEFLGGLVGGVMGAFDALPAWPPRSHSHLEGEGGFALYEAWVRLQAGEAEAALVCAFSRPGADDGREVLGLQHDPYLIGPLAVHPVEMAALQARAVIGSGRHREEDFAAVAAARRGVDMSAVLAEPHLASPLRPSDCSTVCSGAAAAVLVADRRDDPGRLGAAGRGPGRSGGSRPAGARITAMAQAVERHYPGARADLSVSESTRELANRLGLPGTAPDAVELHAPFSHQELVLLDALGLAGVGRVNATGGALAADPVMATGLIRVGLAASEVLGGRAGRAVAHVTNGPCLQHNLLCVLEPW